MELAAALKHLQALDPDRLSEAELRAALQLAFNVLEGLLAERHALGEEVEALRREIARLSGTPPRPTVRPQAGDSPSSDHSSEKERRAPKPRCRLPKRPQLGIDRTEVLDFPPGTLPAGCVSKGYTEVIVQDLVLRRDNICFRRAKAYDPGTGKTYLAPLPAGYTGTFGPQIKALALDLYFEAQVSIPKLHAFFRTAGTVLAHGTLTGWLTRPLPVFVQEAHAVLEAGLRSSPWQHGDGTPTRVNGQNHTCFVLCNPLYTAYRTTRQQDRQGVLDAFRGGAPREYVLHAHTLQLLERFSVARWVRERITTLLQATVFSAPAFAQCLDTRLPMLGRDPREDLEDAADIAAYGASPDWPGLDTLVCDDAGATAALTPARALCWVHDGRHYQKLHPELLGHQRALERFRKRYWKYYRRLRAYQTAPDPELIPPLAADFDALFATATGYGALDACIARTRAHKTELLVVLTHPEVPLQNNPAELGARQRVRKRDVSFGPRSAAGKQAWDVFQTLAATATKLGIRFLDYVRDRLTRAEAVPRLAAVITTRAQELGLGASWEAAEPPRTG